MLLATLELDGPLVSWLPGLDRAWLLGLVLITSPTMIRNRYIKSIILQYVAYYDIKLELEIPLVSWLFGLDRAWLLGLVLITSPKNEIECKYTDKAG